MTPFLTSNLTFEEYRRKFWQTLSRYVEAFLVQERRNGIPDGQKVG